MKVLEKRTCLTLNRYAPLSSLRGNVWKCFVRESKWIDAPGMVVECIPANNARVSGVPTQAQFKASILRPMKLDDKGVFHY